MKNKTTILLCTWVMITMSSLCNAAAKPVTCNALLQEAMTHYDNTKKAVENRLMRAPPTKEQCVNDAVFFIKSDYLKISRNVVKNWHYFTVTRTSGRTQNCQTAGWTGEHSVLTETLTGVVGGLLSVKCCDKYNSSPAGCT